MRQTATRNLVITHPDDKGLPTATSYALHEDDERAWGQIRTWTSMVSETECEWIVRISPLRESTQEGGEAA